MQDYRFKWWTLFGTGLAALMVTIDYTIVANAFPLIQSSLGANITALQWLLSGFVLLFCSTMTVLGRLGDLLGRKKFLLVTVVGFALGSLGAGLATHIEFLIAMRLVQGLFGAAIIPCGMAITANAFPAIERTKALGIFSSMIGIGLAAGPIIGSLITSYLSWHWVFFINVPIGLMTVAILVATVKETRVHEKVAIDYLGAVLLIIALAAFILGLQEGSHYGWLSPFIIGLFLLSMVSAVLFFVVEKRAELPILPLPLLADRYFLLGSFIFTVGIGFTLIILFFIPLYLQHILSYSVHKTGWLLFIMTIMTALIPPVAVSFYQKIGMRWTTHLHFLSLVLGLFLIIQWQLNGSLVWIMLALLLLGIAWGIANGIAFPICLASPAIDSQDAGLISGMITSLANIGGILLLTIVTSVFRHRIFGHFISTVKGNGQMLTGDQLQHLHAIIAQPNQVQHTLSDNGLLQLFASYKQSFLSALHSVYVVELLIVLALWIISYLLIRKISAKGE